MSLLPRRWSTYWLARSVMITPWAEQNKHITLTCNLIHATSLPKDVVRLQTLRTTYRTCRAESKPTDNTLCQIFAELFSWYIYNNICTRWLEMSEWFSARLIKIWSVWNVVKNISLVFLLLPDKHFAMIPNSSHPQILVVVFFFFSKAKSVNIWG